MDMHRFERANLGTAPFRVVACEEKRGPIDMGGGLTVGAPGQPMGCCDYCGTGIVECFTIEGADGRRFEVGNVCVYKTGDKGLIQVVKSKVAIMRTAARHRREAEKIAHLRAILEHDHVLREKLIKQDHPRAGQTTYFAGLSRLDWAESPSMSSALRSSFWSPITVFATAHGVGLKLSVVIAV